MEIRWSGSKKGCLMTTTKTMKYGFELQDWETAKAEMRDVLIEQAKVGGTVSYSDLVKQITAIALEANSYAFFVMLGENSTEEDAEGRGMLSVIVVHKEGDMQPGRGFFELAAELGRDTSDKERCWVEELNEVYRVWGGK